MPSGRQTKLGKEMYMNDFSENPFEWVVDYQMTDEEAASITEPEWIVPNLIVSGHSVAIVAEPNGGKTAILLSLIPEMVLKGYQVFYIEFPNRHYFLIPHRTLSLAFQIHGY